MAQAIVIAALLVLLGKVAVGVMVLFIALFCRFWAIQHRSSSRKKDADLG